MIINGTLEVTFLDDALLQRYHRLEGFEYVARKVRPRPSRGWRRHVRLAKAARSKI